MNFGKDSKDTNSSTNSNITDNMSGSSATSNTSNLNQSVTPTMPDWVSNLAQSLTSGASTLAAAPASSYVAQANPLLVTAANSAGDLTTSPWNYDAAADLTRGVANAGAPGIAGNIKQFMDPYLKQVVGATSADLDHSDAMARAQDNLTMAGNGAFGGSGAALTKAATDDALSRARATTIGGLESGGFSQALGGATSQAQLQQQQQQQRLAAAAQLAGLSSQSAADQRANIASQVGAAQPIQAIDQAKATAPLDLTNWLATVFGGSMPQLFVGQNTNGTQTQTGTDTQSGTENQNGTQIGNGNQSGSSFGFKIG